MSSSDIGGAKYVVVVTVDSASDLFGKHPPSSYVQVTLHTRSGGVTRQRSNVRQKTYNPAWDYSFLVPSIQGSDMLYCEVYVPPTRTTRKQFLGGGDFVFTKHLLDTPNSSISIPLTSRHQYREGATKVDQNITGTVKISFTSVIIPQQENSLKVESGANNMPACLDVAIIQADYLPVWGAKNEKYQTTIPSSHQELGSSLTFDDLGKGDSDELEGEAPKKKEKGLSGGSLSVQASGSPMGRNSKSFREIDSSVGGSDHLADGGVGCSPYVVLKYGKQMYCTQSKEDTCFPVWNETCTFIVDELTKFKNLDISEFFLKEKLDEEKKKKKGRGKGNHEWKKGERGERPQSHLFSHLQEKEEKIEEGKEEDKEGEEEDKEDKGEKEEEKEEESEEEEEEKEGKTPSRVKDMSVNYSVMFDDVGDFKRSLTIMQGELSCDEDEESEKKEDDETGADKFGASGSLYVEVYSIHLEKKVLLGIGTVSMMRLMDQQRHVLVLPLFSPTPGSGDVITGHLHLRLQLTYTEAMKPKAMLRHYGWPLRAVPVRVETGDMVLFYNTNVSVLSLTIKFFSKSKWSHCAMVVRKPDGSMWLAEATQSSDIGLFPIEWRIANRFNRYHTIAFRHLAVERTPEMIIPLFSFLDLVQGRSYEKDINKMFASLLGIGTKTYDAKRDETMMCSEYIANCYNIMGLIHSRAHLSACIIPAFFANDNVPLRCPPSSPSLSATLEPLIIFRCAYHPMPLVSNKAPRVPWLDIFTDWDGENGWNPFNPSTKIARKPLQVRIVFMGTKSRDLMIACVLMHSSSNGVNIKFPAGVHSVNDEIYFGDKSILCDMYELSAVDNLGDWLEEALSSFGGKATGDKFSPSPQEVFENKKIPTIFVLTYDLLDKKTYNEIKVHVPLIDKFGGGVGVILCGCRREKHPKYSMKDRGKKEEGGSEGVVDLNEVDAFVGERGASLVSHTEISLTLRKGFRTLSSVGMALIQLSTSTLGLMGQTDEKEGSSQERGLSANISNISSFSSSSSSSSSSSVGKQKSKGECVIS